MVTIGLGSVRFSDCGFATCSALTDLQIAYKVIVYDVATNNEMKAYIDKAITTSEQKTEKNITAPEQKMKAELDNLKLAMELTTQRQIGEVLKEIRSVVRDEVHHYMRARDGEK